VGVLAGKGQAATQPKSPGRCGGACARAGRGRGEGQQGRVRRLLKVICGCTRGVAADGCWLGGLGGEWMDGDGEEWGL
jgi:hypothetical protein